MYFKKILDDGKTLKIITVGSKGYDQLKRLYEDKIVEKISFKETKNANYFDADKVGKKIIDMFNKNEFDVCTIFYNKFKVLKATVNNCNMISKSYVSYIRQCTRNSGKLNFVYG